MRRNLATIDRNTWQPSMRLIQEAMAHGLTNDMIYGGLLTSQTSMQGLHVAQLTKNCIFGTRRVTWDGKVYAYGKSDATSVAGTIYLARPGMGAKNSHDPGFLGIVGGVANEREAGDDTINILLAAVSADEDWFGTAEQMIGGQIVIMEAGEPIQNRTIIAHGVGAIGATITLTLSGPLFADVPINTMLEIIPNQYSSLSSGGQLMTSVMGVPAVPMTALKHGWIQTWGILWMTPGLTGIGEGNNDRTVVFHDDGSIHQSTDVDWGSTSGNAHQIAGFITHRTVGTGWGNPPFIMLQISP